MLNIVIVFALCGLWHGARWTYVLWGLYAAFWLCLESSLDIRHRFGQKWDTPMGRLARRCVMFLIFIPAALIFRAESMEQLQLILTRLFTQFGFGTTYFASAFASLGLDTLTLAQVLLSIVCMAKIYKLTLYDLTPSQEPTVQAQRTVSYAYLILAVALSWLALLATQDAAGFAYFQF